MKEYSSTAEALKENKEVAVTVNGISMLPMLRGGKDIAVIAQVDRELKVNDVPLYRVSGLDKFVLHRIIEITDKGYIIRGDNVYHTERVKKEDIIGVLKGFYRDGKYTDCATSKSYRLYVFMTRFCYPLRFLFVRKIRPFLSKIKRKILKSNP